MKINKEKLLVTVFFVLVFAFFLLFFTKIHPIVIFDTDDWFYSFKGRVAYPIFGAWNPTRILPETLFSFSILAGNSFLSIFSNDIMNNFVITNAFVVSSFIMLYVYSFYTLLKNKLKLSSKYNILITILFLLLHFLVFRISDSNNLYMFYSLDACCYYYYLIPGLLCSSLVMLYLSNEKFYDKNHLFKTSLYILLCYLAVFSNLFHSIILTSFLGVNLVIKFIDLKVVSKNKNKGIIKKFITSNLFEIIILAIWILVQFSELSGGRASSLESNVGFFTMFNDSVNSLFSVFGMLNTTFVIVEIICLIIGIYILIKEKLYKNKQLLNIVLSMLLIVIYILIVCSKTGAWYITRPDVLIGLMPYIFIMICFSISYMLRKYKKIIIILPLLLFILLFEINTPSITFKESNVLNMSSKECLEISNEIIRQVKEASVDKSKVIYIPKYDSNDNWPLASYGLQRIIESLYKHGVINKQFAGNFEISEEYYNNLDVSENIEENEEKDISNKKLEN